MSDRNDNHDDYHEYRKLLCLAKKATLPKLVLLANAEDERTGDASEVYAFQKPAGRHGIERVPREKAFSPEALASALIAKNGLLPRNRGQATKIVEEASKIEARENWLHLKHDGWQPGFAVFSHAGQIIGSPKQSRIILKAPLATSTRKFPLARRGALPSWQLIMSTAHRSTRLRLALCAAFAAPLLRIVDLQSFSIVLAGRSKAGKSTALLAAGSVIGIGLESGLPNFNATAAALQETAVEFADRVLPVNEIGLVSGTRREAYQALRPLTYRYSEGRDTARHSKSAMGTEGESLEWRGIMLVSSENTFEALAEKAGEKRDEGEYARAFDVPAIRPGMSTIFDTFPRHLPEAGRDAWAREALLKVRQLCAEHHGGAFDAYLRHLIARGPKLRGDIEKAMSVFMKELEPLPKSGALQHAARNFSIIFAGAVLAKKAGLAPTWRVDAVIADLRQCFRDGLDEIKHMQGAEDRARSKLSQRLRGIKPALQVSDLDEADGWFVEEGAQRVFCIRTPAFANWFADEAEQRAAIRWLYEAKLLILRDGANPDFPKLEWAVSFAKLADRNARCYRFKDPTTVV